MYKRHLVTILVFACLAAWGRYGVVHAHGPQYLHLSPGLEAQEKGTSRTEKRRARRPDPLNNRQQRLGALAGALRQLAQRVVTDRNETIAALIQKTTAISRQRILRTGNRQAGFGMQRWSSEVFEQKVDAARQQAQALIADFRKDMPWVTVIISRDGMQMQTPGPRWECLAGRKETIAVEITNDLRQARAFSISGTVAGKAIAPVAAKVAPLSATYAFVEFSVGQPGKIDISLNCVVGERSSGQTFQAAVKPSYCLTLNIVDAATGKPCAARAFIRGSDGRYAITKDRPVVLAGERKTMRFGYVDGRVEALLPAGEVRLKLQKGFEYEIAEKTETMRAHKTVTMKLTRWVDMPREGWYSGDTHVHWVRHTWYENGDPGWLNIHSRAEDLWVNNNLILKHWWKHEKSEGFPQGLVAKRPDMFPVGKVGPLSINGRIVWTGEEYRNDEVFGHMCFLRIDQLIEPVSTGFMGGPEAVHYPPNSYTYDAVHEAGGIVIAAHDVVKEVPIQAILGKLDVLDAHNTQRYYDLLNCGFRLPLSIGSDYPANLMGFARVYVYCGRDLDYNTWVDNLAAGRTFVSSGAVISMSAAGKQIGDTIQVEPGETRAIVVEGRARCRNALQRVEIVYNGDVVKTVPAQGDGKEIKYRVSIPVKGPGWIAARTCPAHSSSWWGQTDVAHSSPIYIQARDKRLVRPAAVRNLVRVLQAGRGAAQSSTMYKSTQQKQAVLDYYDRGIAMFERLNDSPPEN